jgi:hypothetical protein
MRSVKAFTTAILLVAFSASAVAQFGPPNASLIQMAYQAEVSCVLSDPETVLSPLGMREIDFLSKNALHAGAQAWHQYVLKNGVSEAYMSARALRMQQRFSPADAYLQTCQRRSRKSYRAAIAQLKTADPIVLDDLAWVPLMSADREYLGAGLAFMHSAGAWRYLGFAFDGLGKSARTSAIVDSLQGGESRPEIDHVAEFIALCPMPEAPQLKPEIGGDEITKAEDLIQGETEFDPKNTLGAAQRIALQRYAEGKQVPASAIAQLVYAEVLIRSLAFDSAPAAGSPKWQARVRRAEQYFELANLGGADLYRFAPLIAWLADLHRTGAGGIDMSPTHASKLYQIALAAGFEEAAERLTDMKSLVPSDSENAEVPYVPGPGEFEQSPRAPVQPYRCE